MKSLGERTSDQSLWAGKGQLAAVQVLTNGTDNATVIIYDNTSASGTKLFEATLAGSENARLFDFSSPISFDTGAYLDISGTGAGCIPYVK